MGLSDALRAHLESGETTLCRCWAISRRDGVEFGFTDHDLALTFEGLTFKAETGLTAYALQQSTGLSVDNTEALGVLSDAALNEADIEAGRFDGAEVRAWLVNWAAPEQRWLQFRGSIGELKRAGGAFQAELRGLTEALNTPLGRIYQKPCTAVLGDRACGFNPTQPGYGVELAVERIVDPGQFLWEGLEGFGPGWFAGGRLSVLSGTAKGLWGAIKLDRQADAGRQVTLWTPLRAAVAAGDMVRLEAGCDKRAETCRLKFDNLLNYQGFPDIPGEDWMIAYPRSGNPNTGGSRR
ncbi:MAG: DUF2163 domain-containing protein [Aestuariivita sp.]|uniref:DUF2163 domain-containing protein n=1 Tax=Aestuariivita sp. TaxID=1872407 RepID=UPI003BB1C260